DWPWLPSRRMPWHILTCFTIRNTSVAAYRRRQEDLVMTKAKPIPDGYHTATPYLIADDAAKAIEFYKKAFGASEKLRIPAPGGRIGHAEIQIGDSLIMLADEHPEI